MRLGKDQSEHTCTFSVYGIFRKRKKNQKLTRKGAVLLFVRLLLFSKEWTRQYFTIPKYFSNQIKVCNQYYNMIKFNSSIFSTKHYTSLKQTERCINSNKTVPFHFTLIPKSANSIDYMIFGDQAQTT